MLFDSHFIADSPGNLPADLPKLMTTSMDGCSIQLGPDVCRYKLIFHKYINFISFFYMQGPFIINL